MAAGKLRVAVIGVGGAGSAACFYLARAGAEVVGYEQFEVGHGHGSSHGQSRLIRYTYPDRLYTAMMGDAYRLWADVERDAHEELFVRCGGLYFGPEGNTEMEGVRDSLEAAGLPFETLGPEEVAARHPALRLQPGEYAFYQPESGFLRASRCVLAHVRLAQLWGAQIRENTTVQAVTVPKKGGVLVRTAGGEAKTFDRVVVTAGPWLHSLFAGLPLTVTRQEITYLPLREGDTAGDYQPGRLPVWIDAASHWYGFPSDGVIDGIKLALHAPGPVTNPGQTAVATGDIESHTQGAVAAAQYAATRLPGLSLPAVHTQTCLYTNTPDEDFILDTAPGLPDVYLVSGCSGHGFKFTTLLGKIASYWAFGKPSARDLSRFGLSRF